MTASVQKVHIFGVITVRNELRPNF